MLMNKDIDMIDILPWFYLLLRCERVPKKQKNSKLELKINQKWKQHKLTLVIEASILFLSWLVDLVVFLLVTVGIYCLLKEFFFFFNSFEGGNDQPLSFCVLVCLLFPFSIQIFRRLMNIFVFWWEKCASFIILV